MFAIIVASQVAYRRGFGNDILGLFVEQRDHGPLSVHAQCTQLGEDSEDTVSRGIGGAADGFLGELFGVGESPIGEVSMEDQVLRESQKKAEEGLQMCFALASAFRIVGIFARATYHCVRFVVVEVKSVDNNQEGG